MCFDGFSFLFASSGSLWFPLVFVGFRPVQNFVFFCAKSKFAKRSGQPQNIEIPGFRIT